MADIEERDNGSFQKENLTLSITERNGWFVNPLQFNKF